jgi:hypothetical protein
MGWAMQHLNSHILCAVDVQCTGPNPLVNEIIDICILPLDSNIKPNKAIIPFYTCLKPEGSIDDVDKKFVNREKFTTACLRGIEKMRAADMLLEWFDTKLRIPKGKQIQPIAYNWPRVLSFMYGWMGFHQTNIIFHEWYRDVIPYSLHANDSADFSHEQLPYPKSKQSFLESRLKIDNSVRGEVLSDCIAIAEMWVASLKRLF